MYFVDPGEESQEIHQKAQLNLKYFVKYYFKNENIDFIKIENIKQEDNFNCGIFVCFYFKKLINNDFNLSQMEYSPLEFRNIIKDELS